MRKKVVVEVWVKSPQILGLDPVNGTPVRKVSTVKVHDRKHAFLDESIPSLVRFGPRVFSGDFAVLVARWKGVC
jgi:hypothetical protein